MQTLRLLFAIFTKSTIWTYVVYDLDDRMIKKLDGGVCLFVSSLSSCHERVTVALYFGRLRSVRTRLGVVHLQVFRFVL